MRWWAAGRSGGRDPETFTKPLREWDEALADAGGAAVVMDAGYGGRGEARTRELEYAEETIHGGSGALK